MYSLDYQKCRNLLPLQSSSKDLQAKYYLPLLKKKHIELEKIQVYPNMTLLVGQTVFRQNNGKLYFMLVKT